MLEIDFAKNFMKLLNSKFLPFAVLIILVFVFFWQFFLKGLLPIPSDTIVGLYNPFRDFYAKDYPRGIPFKNFLITDPVRQEYPWRDLSISLVKRAQIPLWNPYSFAGTPLLANFQSAVFYPLNLIFLVFPFNIAWSLLILFEVLLSLIFMFLYLNNLRLNKLSSLFGSIVFSFCGFSVAWLEWGTIVQTILWLPLMLLSVDRIFANNNKKNLWSLILALSLIFSFFAGHLQIFFYTFIVFLSYFFTRWVQSGKEKKATRFILISLGVFILITSIQWFPTLQFIGESARSVDQNWQKLGWFIPWQNLLQFLVPDFFGNPATLNYWGVFNYGEFIGYIGVVPLLFSLFALFFKKDKNVFLFGLLFFVSLIFALPTPFAKLPYIFNLPLISTAQPTRLIAIVDFSLAVLSAFGLELFLNQKKKIIYPLGFLSLFYLLLWGAVIFLSKDPQLKENMLVARSNLILPTLIFGGSFVLITLSFLKGFKKYSVFLILCLILLTTFDLFRFAWKFTPFTKSEYLFPNTKVLNFLESQKGQFRIMTTDSRIFSPNFSNVYKIQSVDGYDPLYLLRYGELIAASERNTPNISPPFGFDRIITPHNIDSKLINLLGVKYILSLSDISSRNLKKVFAEGETRVYENKDVLPRAFFVEKTIEASNKNASINILFSNEENLDKLAVVEGFKNSLWAKGNIQIQNYSEDKIIINTQNDSDGFLVLTDSFYPTWHVNIDGKESSIVRTDYNFRGVVVPKGDHTVEFYISLL